MKKAISILLFAVILFSLLSPIQALADSIPEWDTGSNVNTIDVPYDGVFRYIYRAQKNETVEFKVSYNSGVHLTASNLDGEPVSVIRMFNNETISFIVTFQANIEYILNFMCIVHGNQSVITAPWDSYQSRTVTPGNTYSVTIDPDRSYSYLVSVPTSGVYTLIANGTYFDYSITAYPEMSKDPESNPLHLGYWYENDKFRTSYYLQAGKLYNLEIFSYGHTEQKTDSFTIQAGCPTGQYGVIAEGSTDITVDPAKYNNHTYVFVPENTGRYCFSLKNGFDVIVNNEARDLVGNDFITAASDYGRIYELQKGQPYTVTLNNHSSKPVTDTLTIKHYTSVESIQLKIRRSSSSYYEIAVITDPVGAIADGVTWSVSDPSVFSLNAYGDVVSLNCEKEGKAVVTAKVGSKTASLEITSPPVPVTLQLNKEERITIQDYPAGANFTPTESGTYEFRVVPDIYPGYDNLRVILSSGDSECWHDLYINQTQTIRAELTAGNKYELSLSNGCASVTVNKLSSNSPSTTPTESTGSTQPTTQTTQPSQGGSSTQPGQNTTPPTSPSQNPTEPIQGTDSGNTEETSPIEPTEDNSKPENTITKPITKNDVTQAIENASGNVITFSTEEIDNRTFQISAEALQMVVEKDCTLSLKFPTDVNVQLGQDVLKSICGGVCGEDIQISVTPKSFSDLNEKQQIAMKGWDLCWLLDMELTVDGESIHHLGGKAQITFPNDDMNEDWTVLYLAEDGSVEVMDITCDENITFTTEHFSHYALVYQEKEAPAQNDTSSNGWIAIPIVIVVLASAGTAVFFILKKKGLIPFKK